MSIDPLRQAPLAFDEWCEAYDDLDDEDLFTLNSAAKRMLADPVAARVIGKIERDYLKKLARTLPTQVEEAAQLLSLIHGIRAFRASLRSMADDSRLEDFKSR